MKKLKIFLDTSVYSALFDQRDPHRQKQTQEFWKTIGDYEFYYAEIIQEEIGAISDKDLREEILLLLENGLEIDIIEEVKKLSKVYIKEGLIPVKYENDALFLALTTVYSLDILVSWNFRHLVKRKTRLGVNLINLKKGYRAIEILAPPEL